MTRKEKFFVIACFILGLCLVPIIAQQQQSGGNGGGAVSQSGTWTVQPGNTPNTVPWKVDGSSVTQPVSGTVSVNALPAGSAIIGKEVPVTGCGVTVFSQSWVAVPTVSTSLTATTTCPYTISFSNTNVAAQTVTVTDGQGSPVTVVGPAYSIPGLSQVSFPLNGTMLTTGIKWSAGGAGVTGAVLGVQ